MSIIWQSSQYVGHGYLIPLTSGLLLYGQWNEAGRALRSGPVPAAGPLWVLAVVVLVTLAVMGEVVTVAGVGVPLLLAATAYAVAGRHLLRALALPIAFLVFMVPPPRFFEDRILIVLTSLVARASSELMYLLEYPVTTLGNRILVPGHELFVEGACSGLTSVITLLPLSVVVAWFLGHGVWRRALIVASIVPIALGFNIVRVMLTIALVQSRGIEYAQGLLHENLGVATFATGVVVLVGLARLIR